MKSDQPDSHPQSVAFLVAVAAGGLLAMIIGALLDPTSFWSRFVGTIGGGLVGSAFGLLFSRIFSPSPVWQLLKQLTFASSNPWHTSEDDLQMMRGQWHGYLLTKTKGKFVWRYRLFDFERTPANSQLHAIVEVPKPSEGLVRYRYDGFICSPRMVLIGRRDVGAEPCVIQVFPHLSQTDIHAGISCLETWDGDELLTATLLSKDPLIKNAKVGTLEDPAAATLLLDTWRTEFARHQLAPALISPKPIPPTTPLSPAATPPTLQPATIPPTTPP